MGGKIFYYALLALSFKALAKHWILAMSEPLLEVVNGRLVGSTDKQYLQPFVDVRLHVYGKLSGVYFLLAQRYAQLRGVAADTTLAHQPLG